MFIKQFFGKTFAVALAAVALAHAVAIPVQHVNVASLVALGVVFALTAWASWRALHVGLLIAFAEIMVGGHGHLFEANVDGWNVSVRMAIFAAVMGVWVVRFLRREVRPRFVAYRDVPFAILAVAVAVATVVGFANNVAINAFDDMNSYLTLAYLLPLASIEWTAERKRDLLQIFAASMVWIGVSTLLIVYLFTHLPGGALRGVYEFVRDARLAEVTLLTEPAWFVQNFLPASHPWYFRVFEPAHFFSLVMLFVLMGARFILCRNGRMPTAARALFILAAATFIASLSRSFVLGALAGGAATAAWVAVDRVRPIARTVGHAVQTAFLVFLGAVLFWAAIVVPVPTQPDLRDAAFYRETSDDTRNMAVSSRWNLLWPMFDAIMDSPVIGAGFGKEVTFISDDPRVRDINPSGEWTTYRFEWGYQDIWLKMGLLGLIGVIAYFICTAQAFMYTFRTQGHRWITIGLFAGVCALYVTHIFSPYLNHPIGLGYMLFVLPFFDWTGMHAAFVQQQAQCAALKPRGRMGNPMPALEREQ